MIEAPTRSRAAWVQATRRLLVTLAAFAAVASAGVAQAVVRNVPGTYPTISAGMAAAAPFDVVLVAPGTYVVTSTISASTSDVTLQGSGIGSTIIQVASGVGNLLSVTASNFTLRDCTIEKTDTANQGLILILGSGCTVRDNEIYGPDPGSPWSVNGLVSRAMEIGGGASGLLITGNNIHHLRQPAYINGPTVGTISSNLVSGTRGWVIDGASITFTGNSWGPVPQNQGADIALLASCTAVQYPNLLALSSGNGNAYISGQFAGAASGRADGYSNAGAAPGGNGSVPAPYLTVQGGVNGTLPGGTVHVAAGAYTEQVIIAGKNLTVRGAGSGSTTIQAPAALATTFTTSGPNKPVVTADGAANVRIEDLKVDGMGNGNANNRIVGIGYWNAGGGITNVAITRIRSNPLDGVQAGVGVLASNNTGGPYGLGLSSVAVNDFQKNGMSLAGAGMTVSVTGGSVTGAGNTALIAQNGIQISGGAGGTVNGTAISALRYTPASVVSVGLLVFGPGGSVAASNLTGVNRFQGVQVPIYFIDASGSVNGAEVDATSSDQGAIFEYNSSLSALRTKQTQTRAGAPVASPDEDGDGALVAKNGRTTNSSLTFSVSNACLTGSGSPNTQGIGIYSDGGPVSATISNNTIASWAQGILAAGAAVSVVAHDNSITGNTSAGFDNSASLAAQDAERNWWGSATGPSGTGPGTGDAVLGANVDFNPWRTSGADLSPACGFQPDPDNQVSVGPAPSCLTGPCITIPVSINRTDSSNLRGYSVDIQLSANLVLCTTPSASITRGPYLATGAGINGTNFQIVSNGGGSYTVDEAILGLPCGATGAGGNLFNISVKAAGGGDGTGTITVTAVTLRDCSNAPIASSVGAPVNITIDQTAPAPIAALTATQVKVGNDGDGTTKITLAWPAVEAGATVGVYRAKFGNYPEYDDPPTPGSPPNAASAPGAPWVLTGVTVSGTTDEVSNRDFWYYVAFVRDACGNVSTVSNRTNGTLNYHLGDVSNGFVAGQGNNLVDTADMSLLGANYGIFGAPVAAVAYLDVGPTTDFSVNARPTTDDRVNFEDLIMFAINYGTVSAPGTIADRPSAGVDQLTVATSGSVGVGETLVARVHLLGSGRIQGLSTQLSWNPRAVAPIGFEAGGMVTKANGVVYSPAPGTVDAALLGVRDQGLAGAGDIATVRFKVLAAIDPEIVIGSVTARDAQNQPVLLGASEGRQDALPKTTLLMAPAPNPTARVSTLAFSLAHPGRVNLAIYSVGGRKVRTLVAEDREAGFHSVSWNGTGDDGQRVGAGIYFARMLTSDGGKQSRVVTLLGQ